MSSIDIINNFDSKNTLKYLNNRKLSSQSSTERLLNPKPKKINIYKFLTKEIFFEQKKNYKIEKRRYEQILREKKYFTEKPFLTARYLGKNKINKGTKEPFLKTVIENIYIKRQKFLESKRNNTFEGIKDNNLFKIKNKYKKKKLSKMQLNRFFPKQKINSIKNTNKKEFKNNNEKLNKGKNIEEINKKLPKYINKKAKFNHEKIIYGIYEQKELMNFKMAYLKNKYSYQFKPIINNNKYNNISSKYAIISQNKLKNNYNFHRNNSQFIYKKSNKRRIINNSNDLNTLNNVDNIRIKKNKYYKNIKSKLNNSEELVHLSYLLKTINRNEDDDNDKDNKDNTYSININESLPWNENLINNIPYEKKIDEIIKRILI